MSLEPLDYAAPTSAESKHARHNVIYTALLIALAFFFCLGMISLYFVTQSPTFAAESRWAFHMIMGVYAALVAGVVITLVLRAAAPRAGRIATLALNIVLLVVFPVGTALAIYGLWKVDKNHPA
jgi:hypothetical protein